MLWAENGNPIRTYGPKRVHKMSLLAISGNKGSNFRRSSRKPTQEVAIINISGSSQLTYKLKVEAVSLYFKVEILVSYSQLVGW
jgi:hypothetical protein